MVVFETSNKAHAKVIGILEYTKERKLAKLQIFNSKRFKRSSSYGVLSRTSTANKLRVYRYSVRNYSY